ncbi:MAG TPA: TonB-dependent receptor plug domain-containing protein [Cyclobacteriaceae bacterium]
MRLFASICLVFFCSVLVGQHHPVQIVDAETGAFLEGSAVAYQAKDLKQTVISGVNGAIDLPNSLPIIISIRHIGYEQFTDTLIKEIPDKIHLQPFVHQMDEVVVTGQFQAQSVRNSVYSVRTIGEERIRQQGANQLQDVLAQELNFRFSRDNATGRAGIFLQGLSGQYVKVLVDGVPLTGRSGTANEIDLNQINVNAIERIEIVEGPLAVNYGADALAGVVNIITKKSVPRKLSINATIQEETVGNEYSATDGIHNHALVVGYNLSKNWFIQGEIRNNDFGGWTGNGSGRNKSWYPKSQLFTGGLLRYAKDNSDVYYRFDYLDEKIENLGVPNENNPLIDAFAIDENYLTQRYMHQLQGDFSLGKSQLNTVFSYTDFQRNTHQFTKNLVTEDTRTTTTTEQDTIRYQAFFFRSTLANALQFSVGKSELTTQIGLEANHEIASGTNLTAGEKSIQDAAAFLSAEWSWDLVKIRPGIRFAYNSIFETIPTPSINFKYAPSTRLQIRLGYGRGFRAPSVRELYHEFIDANHNILGNENLKPEYSHNFNGDVTYQFTEFPLKASLNGFYNNITNRITFFIPEQANQPTTYTNLFGFKSTGGNLRLSYSTDQINVNTGFSYIGLNQHLDAKEIEQPGFVFSPEWNFNGTYTFKKLGVDVSAFYKYTGRAKRYQLITNELGEQNAVLQWIEAFNWLDITVSKQIKDLTIGVGSRNLLNITSVNNNISGGGAHSGGGGATPIAYGRSYFLRINYQFNQ